MELENANGFDEYFPSHPPAQSSTYWKKFFFGLQRKVTSCSILQVQVQHTDIREHGTILPRPQPSLGVLPQFSWITGQQEVLCLDPSSRRCKKED